MSLYLDASVLVPTIIMERDSPAVIEALLARDDDLTVSDFAIAEVASALARLVRMGRLTIPEATDRLADFDTWRAAETDAVDIIAHDCRLADRHVRRFELKLRAPDGLHLAICRRLGLQLATLDRRLAAAARVLGIEVLVPGE
jgi:uncharacterized protein